MDNDWDFFFSLEIRLMANSVLSSASHRLAPMRLYTLSKRHFVLVFVVFFICFGLTVFIGIAGKDVAFLKQKVFACFIYMC